jgi:hypothetical protein
VGEASRYCRFEIRYPTVDPRKDSDPDFKKSRNQVTTEKKEKTSKISDDKEIKKFDQHL